MQFLLVAFLFVLVAVALAAVGAALLPQSKSAKRLRLLLGSGDAPKPTIAEKIQTVIEPAAKILPKSQSELNRTRQWLTQAGYRESSHVTFYFAIRGLCVAFLALLVLVTGLWRKSPFFLFILPLLGWMLPRFILKKRINSRANRIRLALPDALDLLVICVEAGLGLDQALQRVASELKPVHPDLCGEFELLGLEMRAGVPRGEALRNLSERTQVPDLRALTAVLVQTDRFGTSVATALRVHSDALRTERKQRAEEAAAKLSIKMLPVLALLVFPAILIVCVGPAGIAIIRHFAPALPH